MKRGPAVVLVRPTEEGNVGAVARAMVNTGLDRLILVEPAVPVGPTARARAVGGASIVDSCERAASLDAALAPFRHVVGTSSQRERSLRSRTVEPRELAGRLAGDAAPSVALVFGPERSGLTTEELARCTTVVSIPAAPELPTLNLSQAVLIVAHELFLARRAEGPDATASEIAQSPAATTGEIEGLMEHADSILRSIGFARDSTYEGVVLDLRRLAGRARLTEREVTILRGLCRRLDRALSLREPVV